MAELLKNGICGVCDVTQIWYKDGPRTIQTDQYCEFTFVLSDGMVYRHAICQKCIVELDDIKAQALIERIKEHWAQEMVGWATDHNFDTMRSLEIKAFHPDEERALQKYEQVTAKEFKEHLKEVKEQKEIAGKLGEELVA